MIFGPIPLPKVVGDVGPAGGIPTAMNALNELSLSGTKAKYAPLTTQAEAASKLAYSNLIGPQYLAKLFNNPEFLGATSDEQKNAILKYITAAGTSTPGNYLNNVNPMEQPQSPFSQMVNGITSAFGFKPRSSNNALATSNYQNRNQPSQYEQPAIPSSGSNNADRGYSYDENGNNARATSQDVQNVFDRFNGQNNAAPQAPTGTPQPLDLGGGVTGTVTPEIGTGFPPPTQERSKTNAEKVGEYQGTIEEGKEAGKIRAKAIEDFGKEYQAVTTRLHTYDELSRVVTSPEFKEMETSIPFLKDKNLAWIEQNGTDKQKELIGQFTTNAEKIVADTINSFQGQKLSGEVGIAQNMKANKKDSIGTMIGKLQAAMVGDELVKQRSTIAANLMEDRHISRQKALEQADKMIDGNKIRNEINAILHPKPTEADIKHMADKYKTTPEDIRKRLKDKGIL